MTQQQHPIAPPPKLREQWQEQWLNTGTESSFEDWIINCAAQWGADQELEACCEWLDRNCPSVGAHHLRTERRPKPPSLKELALKELEQLRRDAKSMGMGFDAPAIRRALESIPDPS